MAANEVQGDPGAGSAIHMGCQHVHKDMFERDVNPHDCDLPLYASRDVARRIVAGQRCAYVSEGIALKSPWLLTTEFSLVSDGVLGGAKGQGGFHEAVAF